MVLKIVPYALSLRAPPPIPASFLEMRWIIPYIMTIECQYLKAYKQILHAWYLDLLEQEAQQCTSRRGQQEDVALPPSCLN